MINVIQNITKLKIKYIIFKYLIGTTKLYNVYWGRTIKRLDLYITQYIKGHHELTQIIKFNLLKT